MSSLPHQSNSNAPPNNPTLTTIRSLPKELRNLIAGGLAGMIAKSVVAPIDRIKILYQVTSAQFRLRDVPKVAYSIVEKEGAAALWKGNTATMIRVFPYSGIQFMVFDYGKVHFLGKKKKRMHDYYDGTEDGVARRDSGGSTRATISHRGTVAKKGTMPISTTNKTGTHKQKKPGLTPIESLISGMIAGTVSVLCTYPLDLARAQLAVLRKTKKPKVGGGATAASTIQIQQKIAKSSSQSLTGKLGIGGTSKSSKGIGYVLSNSFQQGGARGLYRGITPTILGILPYSGIAFTINEQAKRQITHIMHREPSTIERLQCGALSGLFAQTLAYPLEVTRRRMQTIGIVPTSGNESAAVNFTGVSKLTPSADELPVKETEGGGTATQQQQQQQRQQSIQQHGQQTTQSSQRINTPTTHNSSNSSIAQNNGSNNTATKTSQHPQKIHPPPKQIQQHHHHHHHHNKPPSMITTMQHLFQEQGVRGFYKGVSMNWVKGPIAFSISFTAFDTLQGWIETEMEREARKGGGGYRSSSSSSASSSSLSSLSKENSKIVVQRRLTSNED